MPSIDARGRAAELLSTTETKPAAVDVDELVDLLVFGTRETRRIAFDAYESLASARPTTGDASANRLSTHLTADSADTRHRAALTVGVLVETHADAFAGLVPALRTIGESTEPGREPAIVALAKVATKRPNAVTSTVETFLDVCDESIPIQDAESNDDSGPHAWSDGRAALQEDREHHDTVRLNAIAALTLIANEDPGAMKPYVARVAALLEDDHNLIRGGACELLEAVATAHPSAVVAYAAQLAERAATDTKHPVPWRAADALVALEAKRPKRVGEAVAPHVEEMTRFVDARSSDRRQAGSRLIAATAVVQPESIQPLLPDLRDLLSADESAVRANAVVALGAAGDTDDRTTIETLAKADPAEQVRKTAVCILG